jgi:hypothetical protein
MRRVLTTFVMMAAIIQSSLPAARAYTLQYADDAARVKIKWHTNKIIIWLSTSLAQPQPNIKTGSDVVMAVHRALERWSEVANIEFDVRSASEQSVSAADSGGDGKSLITVAPTAENLALFQDEASELSGRTRLFFTKSGRITEADIVLNPLQQFSTDGAFSTYDLEATLTHEIGHLLGLEHSCMIGATMQPSQGKNGIYSLSAWTPRTLSEDDKSGVHALYGLREEVNKRGTVTGKITDENNLPVFGANVWVEDSTGRVVATNLTLPNGTYRLAGLLAGEYRIMVEPLDEPISPFELVSRRGVYSALLSSELFPFRTKEISTVKIEGGKVTTVNAQVESETPTINPTRIGFNAQLSTISVPINAGYTYTIYVGGDEITQKQIESLTVSSPFIEVVQNSAMPQQYGPNIKVLSVSIIVSADTPPGEYSVRFQTKGGEVAYIVGGLTVDNVVKNQWRMFGPLVSTED